MRNRLLHKMAKVMAVWTTITIAPTLLRRMAERIGCSSMDIPLVHGWRTAGTVSFRWPSLMCGRGYEIAKFGHVDVTSGNDRDNRSRSGLSRECRGQRQRSCALCDDARLLRQHAHRLLGLLQADDDCAVNHRLQPLPHAREKALAPCAIDERGLPILEHLRRSH